MAAADAPARLVADALRLRDWARPLLAGAPAAPPPDVSPAAWALFLGRERCALLLASRHPAPPPALTDAARREAKRLLSARAQLRLLGATAASLGVRAVVLKGGAAADDGVEVDVLDVDVLLADGDAARFAAALDGQGFRAGLAEAPEGFGGQHLAPRVLEGAVPVEVHRWLRHLDPTEALLARGLPLRSAPGLWRLHPADHLWHLLVHAVIQHPLQRGRLRDVVLTSASYRAADPEVRAAVGRRAAESPFAEAVSAALAGAGAAPSPAADPFRREAAAAYALGAAPLVRRLPAALAAELPRRLQALVGTRADRAAAWAGLSRQSGPASPVARVVPMGRARALGVLRAAARAGWYAACTVAAWGFARWVLAIERGQPEPLLSGPGADR